MIATTPNYDDIGGCSQEVLKKGGEKALLEELEEVYEKQGPSWYGVNVVTSPGPSGELKCKSLIHTVGPVHVQLDPLVANGHLHNCVMEGLKKANELGAKSISMPCICTGMYGAGFPKEDAADIIVTSCVMWLQQNALKDNHTLKDIEICDFDRRTCEFLEKSMCDIVISRCDLSVVTTQGDNGNHPDVVTCG